jgi:hypothetical protein
MTFDCYICDMADVCAYVTHDTRTVTQKINIYYLKKNRK